MIDTSHSFQGILKNTYAYHLNEIKFLLNDSKIYVERHFSESQGEINYHNWFLYEQFMLLLKEADEMFLSQHWLDRLMAHPFNILQYYQVP